MSIDLDAIRALSAAEKLQLVEFLWDELEKSAEPWLVSKEVIDEMLRRREQLREHPELAVSHDAMWQRIKRQHG